MKFLPLFLLTLLLCTLLCAPQIAAQNYKPEQIRLELTGTETEMTVIYTTGSSTNSNFKTEYLTAPKPQVWWGTTSTPSTLVGGKTNHFDYSGYIADIHAVTLKGLKPGTTYYYKVGDSSYKDGVSQVYSLKLGIQPNGPCLAIMALPIWINHYLDLLMMPRQRFTMGSYI